LTIFLLSPTTSAKGHFFVDSVSVRELAVFVAAAGPRADDKRLAAWLKKAGYRRVQVYNEATKKHCWRWFRPVDAT
jgi:hypothetical protein